MPMDRTVLSRVIRSKTLTTNYASLRFTSGGYVPVCPNYRAKGALPVNDLRVPFVIILTSFLLEDLSYNLILAAFRKGDTSYEYSTRKNGSRPSQEETEEEK